MPRRPDGGITISTIGDHLDEFHRIYYYCEDRWPDSGPCYGSGEVDLVALAESLGRDHGALAKDLKPHIFCERCGGNNVTFRLHPPTSSDGSDRVPSPGWSTPKPR